VLSDVFDAEVGAIAVSEVLLHFVVLTGGIREIPRIVIILGKIVIVDEFAILRIEGIDLILIGAFVEGGQFVGLNFVNERIVPVFHEFSLLIQRLFLTLFQYLTVAVFV
jgi:hypothetical protein